MRIAEILSDFRHLQHAIANIRANPSAEEYYEEGYCVLRQCAAEAQALLNQPFDCQGPEPDGDGEQEKAQLQRVMLDASIRRFKIQQIYLKASAALRWLTSRNAILGGNRPQPIHTPALQQIANTMRAVRFSSPYLFFSEILHSHMLSYAIEAVKMHDAFHSRAWSSEAHQAVHFSGQRC
ncbi:hypothetical protein D6C93_09051 [Aureobasidium pullulans]|nr:hypothetical protein D6C93_09051 [Aureobasidium pullulans]